MYSLIKNYSHGGSPMNLMITFADYFYSKYYCGHSVASSDAKGEASAHATRHNHHRTGPARFCSLDFGEHNGYLKGVARAKGHSIPLITLRNFVLTPDRSHPAMTYGYEQLSLVGHTRAPKVAAYDTNG